LRAASWENGSNPARLRDPAREVFRRVEERVLAMLGVGSWKLERESIGKMLLIPGREGGYFSY